MRQPNLGRLAAAPAREPDLRFRTVHGYRRAFRVAGSGLPLVLVHGIGDNSTTWEPVIPGLPDGTYAGHFPFHIDPVRFVRLLEEFVAGTAAAHWSPEQWRQLLRAAEPPLHPVAERSAT